MELRSTVFLFLAVTTLWGVAQALPAIRSGRQQQVSSSSSGDNAEVVKIVDSKTPIFTDPLETPSLEPRTNGSQPIEIPESQPVTDSSLPNSASPSLVPSVVEISTPDPQNTPPPPAAAPPGNSTTPPEEEDDNESDEEESDEEADEEDEDEDDDDDDDDDDEEEEEDVEDEESNDLVGPPPGIPLAKKVVVKREVVTKQQPSNNNNEEIAGSFKEHKVQLGSVVILEEDKASEEEQEQSQSQVAPEKIKINKINLDKLAVGGSSALQGVPARGPTNEDDEVESAALGNGASSTSIVL